MKKLAFVGLAAANALAMVAKGRQGMVMSKGRADQWHLDELIGMSATSAPAEYQ